ncbi:metallophosphoesterase [Pontibacter sp. G13]|uniref:metallophosphoesterase n=1 Tax=Pontibacter sp. G13 TaxID=3074898 RepID=UPI002889A3BC|nr:metallophosphoesterase [Pontibacter sp. G13]WNJ20295.1 metallophosphoesterase [Pontibacter sp. G13]
MKQMILMLVGFLGVIVGANVYLAQRFGAAFGLENLWPMYVAFGLATVFSMGGLMAWTHSTSALGNLLFGVASIMVGFLLYLILTTVVVHLASLVLPMTAFQAGGAALILAALISGYGVWNSYQVRTTYPEIEITGLDRPVRAAHLTDTHLGHFRDGDDLAKIVQTINEENVDVVFFTGDLLDGKIQLKREAMAPLANLDAPVFFVEGNHDEHTGVDAIKGYLRELGVVVLENQITEWEGIQIVGLNHMLADDQTTNVHADPNGPTIQKTLGAMSLDADKPTILLHHGPDGIQYAHEAGVDLYLAGHTHAGQMWPLNYVAEMMFDYNRGLHRYEDTQIYVSQGTGTFGPPMRVGTESELAILTLLPK